MTSSAESTQDFQGSQSSPEEHFYSTFIVEYIVPEEPEAEVVFRQWYAPLVGAASQFEGYTRTDLCPPLSCDDGVVKWYSIVHFRTPQELSAWLKSSDRADLFKQGRDTFLAYRYKSGTGLVFAALGLIASVFTYLT